jgi:hypothetical protein
MSPRFPPRSETLAVVCPTCGAMTDHPCVGKRGQPRKPLHAMRHRLAAELQGVKSRDTSE